MIWLKHKSSMEETIRWKCDENFTVEGLGCHHLIHQHMIVIDCVSRDGPNNISHPLLLCDLVTARSKDRVSFQSFWSRPALWLVLNNEMKWKSCYVTSKTGPLEICSFFHYHLEHLFRKTTPRPRCHKKAQARHVEVQPHKAELRSQT